MGRSTVIINGKTYDAISGLPMEDSISVEIESPVKEFSEKSNASSIKKDEEAPKVNRINVVKAERRSLSKQERIAAAIQNEFGIDAAKETSASDSEESPRLNNVDQVSQSPQTADQLPKKTAPDWLKQFTEDHAESNPIRKTATSQPETHKISADQPAWITNYVEGGTPIEIEPIGLEKAAKESLIEQSQIRQTATSAGRTPQHSQTLNRSFVKKPAAEKTSFAQAARTSAPVATHPLVRKFDKVYIPVTQKSKDHAVEKKETVAAPQPVLTQSAVHNLKETSQSKSLSDAVKEESAINQTKSNQSLKEALIKEQLSATGQKLSKREQRKLAKQSGAKRRLHASTLVTAGMVLAIFGGFFTYTQMPNISVRVAANRAGIDAKNPYMPSGYSIDGSVAYSRGSVTINYKSNGGGEGYSFTQQRSNSNNVNIDKTSGNYETLMTGDLVIYRYGDKATWSDSGVLYTLNSNGRITDNQILEIASSV